ncbi:MAG: molybdopterin-dependent oxidoreductase [Opitutaceae bacterium]|nr:molybdopterin-dependent oxidoreductase [Opitutaceae bacterium]
MDEPAAKMRPLTRRRWLGEALAFAGWPAILRALEPGEEPVPFADDGEFQPEVHAASPRVRCFDLRRLQGPITPIGEFFVFHQTTAPRVDAAAWRLEIAGLVERPGVFTLADLARIAGEKREFEFTLECAGNLPRPEIMQGQVGNARWTGFSLPAILQHCGVKPEAREAVFFGADQVRDSAGVAHGPHARSVFVQDVLASDALLATHMNGEVLPVEHGFPLRLILPGWYGMAQIKWLTRIEFIDRRYEGPHMSRNYHTLHVLPATGREPIVLETSISKTRLKSVVARIARRRLGRGWSYRVIGAAWGGAAPIERVEVSVDGGTWQPAQIDERRGKHAWVLWSVPALELSPGRHTVTSRAIDARGAVQPSAEAWQKGIRSARENNAQWERVIVIPG